MGSYHSNLFIRESHLTVNKFPLQRILLFFVWDGQGYSVVLRKRGNAHSNGVLMSIASLAKDNGNEGEPMLIQLIHPISFHSNFYNH